MYKVQYLYHSRFQSVQYLDELFKSLSKVCGTHIGKTWINPAGGIWIGTAYCIWSVISSISDLHRSSSSLDLFCHVLFKRSLFCHVPFKRDNCDGNWRLRLNGTPNAICCVQIWDICIYAYICVYIYMYIYLYIYMYPHIQTSSNPHHKMKWHSKCNRLYTRV